MILVAHENELHAKIFAHVLMKFGGWAVTTLNDADQLLPRLRKQRPDLLLISDWFGHAVWSLDPSSYDLVRMLRHDPTFADLPILMLYHGMKQAQKATEVGCTPVSVDIHPEELIETVQRFLVPSAATTSQASTS